MTIALIAFVLLLGIILIFLEVFVIPGTTVFGIMGTVCVIAAIYFCYKILGMSYGHASVVLGFITFMIFFVAGKKLMSENNMSLNKEITSKVNKFEANVKVGDIGRTFTDVKPNGKAFFADEKLEIYSTGAYIDEDVEVKIIKIVQNKIIVKPLN